MSDIEGETVQGEGEAAPVETPTAAAMDLPVVYQIEVGSDAVIVRTMAGNALSAGFIEVDQETHDAARDAILSTGAWYRDGRVEPMPAPPPPPIVLSAEVLFFDRMTSDEYDALEGSIAGFERANIVRGWRAANSFTENTDMWRLIVRHLTPDPSGRWAGVADERRAELLARP